MLRIRDVYTDSRVRCLKDPEPGSASHNISIFNPKNCFQALGNMIRDVHPDPGPDFFSIPGPDPGPQGKKTQKAPDPGSRIRKTGSKTCHTKIFLREAD